MMTVRVDGVDRLLRDLDKLQSRQFRFRLRVVIGELLRNAIARYPPKPQYPLRWASQKQRFWHKRAAELGEIEVPYRRQFSLQSQRTGLGWAVATESDNVFVGTRVTYAPYVQSAAKQQPFHADTGWVTDEKAVNEVAASGDISRVARKLLDSLL